MSFYNNTLNTIITLKNYFTGRTMTGKGFISQFIHDYSISKAIFSMLPCITRIYLNSILCGIPRSGTHWIMNVISKSTGNVVYDIPHKIPNEHENYLVMVKIHARNKFVARMKARMTLPPHQFSGKYIYTYRDPRDAIISLYEKYKIARNVPDLSQADFLKRYDPIGQYLWEINSWVKKSNTNVLLIKYEDLLTSPILFFEKIFNYLEIPFIDVEDYIFQRVRDSETNTNRDRATIYSWKNSYKQYQDIILAINERIPQQLEYLGYDE